MSVPFTRRQLLKAALATSTLTGIAGSLLKQVHAMEPPSGNPYLQGNYAPVSTELTTLDLRVTGQIPADLIGTLIRNGPNPYGKVPETHHWFIGDGMLHGIRLEAGHAKWYRNRWVNTHSLRRSRGETLDQTPGWDLRFNPANTNLIGHGARILALCDGGWPYEISPELDTIGVFNYDGKLQTSMTAHPKIDPLSGELCFFGALPFPPFFCFYTANPAGELVSTLPVNARGFSMMHDFQITEHYALFMDLPVVFDMDYAQKGTLPFRWDESYGARLGVLPRSGGETRWFDIPPCYVFHPVNACEEGDRIIWDVVRYPRMFASSPIGPIEENNTPILWRWTIDLKAGTVTEDQLDDRGIEFPRTDPRVLGLPHRYSYAVAEAFDIQFAGTRALIRYDRETGTCLQHSYGAGRSSDEAVFVPRDGSSAEDDGYLLSTVYDKATDTSDLVILHAQDFEGDPVATIHLPQRVPYGFHGNWIAG